MTDPSGNLCVDSRPPGATIQIDGEDMVGKTTPTTVHDLSPGAHTVRINLPDYDPVSKTVDITAGATATLILTIMTPENNTKVHRIGYYTLGFMILLVGLALATRMGKIPWPDVLTRDIFYFACAGGLGSLTFNMYGYIQHLSVGDFNVDYYKWYLFRPITGIIYGTFIFFFIAGGVMTLSNSTAPAFDSLFKETTVMFYIALSFLAGYAEEPVSIQLKAIAEAIFKKPGKEGS